MKVDNEDKKNKPIENRHRFNNRSVELLPFYAEMRKTRFIYKYLFCPSEISSLIYFVCIDKTNLFKIKKGSSMGRIRKLISSNNGIANAFWEI